MKNSRFNTLVLFNLTLFVGYLVFLIFFPGTELRSQNAAYHLRLAELLQKGDWSYISKIFLPHSSMATGFIDQHYAYHFLISLLLNFSEPIWAIKILTIFGLALGFVGLTKLFKERNIFIVLSFYILFLFAIPEVTRRLFWERPQFLAIPALTYLLVLVTREKLHWTLLAAVSFLLSLISFEIFVLTCSVVVLQALVYRQRWWGSLAVLAIASLSLLVFPWGTAKLLYLKDLAINNIFYEKNISEWKSSARLGAVYFSSTVILSVACLIAVFKVYRKQFDRRLCLFLALAVLFFGFFSKADRFAYLFVWAAVLLALQLFPRKIEKKWLGNVVASALLMVSLWAFAQKKDQFGGDGNRLDFDRFSKWYAKSSFFGSPIVNYKWEFWSPLFYINSDIRTEPGFSMFVYKDHPKLVEAYEKMRNQPEQINIHTWQTLFRELNSSLFLVPSGSSILRLIGERKFPFAVVFADPNWTLLKFLDPENVYKEYEALKPLAYKCIAKECPYGFTSRRVNDHQIDLVFPMSEASRYVDVAELSRGYVSYYLNQEKKWIYADSLFFDRSSVSSVGMSLGATPYWTFPFFKNQQGVWKLAPKNLLAIDEHSFLDNLEGFYLGYFARHQKIFYSEPEQAPETLTSGRLRKLLGVYSVCQFSRLKKTCGQLVSQEEFRYNSKWDLGSLAILGLIYRHFDLPMRETHLKNISQLVQKSYDKLTMTWPGLSDRSAMFAVGEALSFLASVHTSEDLPWLKPELQKYAAAYFSSENIYYVRWLLSASYYFYDKNPASRDWIWSLVERTILILNEKNRYAGNTPSDFSGCFINTQSSPFIFNANHHSGLILEGLSYFSQIPRARNWPQYDVLVKGYLACTLRQQIQKDNYVKMGASKEQIGAVRLEPGIPRLQIDVLGHLGIGVFQFLNGPVHDF
ncbi:MAG: hypothetical protein H7326_08945 [Bdellovibrionaceae bacterium]|nr:hypothetical protein [Pseudobdellovibrionaceae bacterium]